MLVCLFGYCSGKIIHKHIPAGYSFKNIIHLSWTIYWNTPISALNHIHLHCTLDTPTHSIFVNYQHLQVQSILLGYSYQKKIIQITLLCWSSYIHTLFINISVSIDWILLHIRVIYQHLKVQLIILLSSIGSILDTHPKGVSPGYSPLDTSSSTDQIFNPLAQTAKRIITH